MPKTTPQFQQATIPRNPGSMPYVRVAPCGRYFATEDGEPFLVVGHNDAMPWPGMHNLHYERDVATTEEYIKDLVAHGVTVMRVMLEYVQDRHWLFERPVGNYLPEAVLYWDDLIGLCERHGMRLLVLFWDTFFLSRRWKYHPYSRKGTGFDGQWSMCTSPQGMEHEKARIRFFIDRWGDSPAIFGYDLFNEIHPHWGGTPEEQHRWVAEMARFVKSYETEKWGKRHLLTVSVFGAFPEPGYIDLILRHPELDFATTHVYQNDAKDNPKDTLSGAITMRDAVRFAYAHMVDVRPYMDTESGPIFGYMHTRQRPTPEFENEYYHNMTWAHLATGGAGSGMRWPFRDPHTLSPGMHDVMLGMSRFIEANPLRWLDFSPRPSDDALRVVPRDAVEGEVAAQVLPFGCSDGRQALVWLLRDTRVTEGQTANGPIDLLLPGMVTGGYIMEFWETYKGNKVGEARVTLREAGGTIRLPLPQFGRDLAIAVRLAG
ncbi:MAG TPA: hypothetical protein VND68_06990 [Chloroflexia bacterium]|nr:hypothetical protein [Chloroflexia bacterium]